MVAGRRYMAEQMAKYKPVYSYRFNQPPDNVTIDVGVSAVSSRRQSTRIMAKSPRILCLQATHYTEVAFVFSVSSSMYRVGAE